MTLDLIKKGKDLIHPRAIVLRFDCYMGPEKMWGDANSIIESAKTWVGERIPAFFYYRSMSKFGGVMTFGEDIVKHPGDWPVGFLPLDYDGIREAVLNLKWASTLRVERNFDSNPYPPKASETRRFTKAVEISPPIRPDQVSPKWRFLLTDEAKKDGREFYKQMTFYGSGMSISDPGHWMRKLVIGRMAERWPNVARADKLTGGLISLALEAVAANPKYPAWWLRLPIALEKGYGDSIEPTCRGIIAGDPDLMVKNPVKWKQKLSQPTA
ncbi:hypothetical protein [Mesorhizobium sp. A623]